MALPGVSLTRIAFLLEATSVRIGVAVARLGIPLMIALAAMEPLTRWLGGADEPFSDASTAAFLAMIMTSFGYAYASGAHMRLDLLSRRLPLRINAAIELAGTALIVIPLCAVIAIDGTDSAWRSFRVGERWAETSWSLQWALRAWVPAGFLLLMLAAIASALRAFVSMFRR